MAQWKRGQSGNPAGRPVGSPNKWTKEIREILDENVDYQDIVQKLYAAAKRGNVKAADILLSYRFGRPTVREEVTIDTSNDMEGLVQKAEEVLLRLKEDNEL
jgi:hypothetical protein